MEISTIIKGTFIAEYQVFTFIFYFIALYPLSLFVFLSGAHISANKILHTALIWLQLIENQLVLSFQYFENRLN